MRKDQAKAIRQDPMKRMTFEEHVEKNREILRRLPQRKTGYRYVGTVRTVVGLT